MKVGRRRTGVIPKGDERGIALVVTLWGVALLFLLGIAFLSAASTESTITSNRVKSSQAFTIAEAGVEHARRQLVSTDVEALLEGGGILFNGQVLGGGTYSVAVSNNTSPPFPRGVIPADSGGATNDTDGFLVISSTGTVQNASHTIEIVVRPPVPPGVKGAVTTNSPTATNGGITIDGRNHDIDGNLIAGSGTYAIYTADTYTQGGSSLVGGTNTNGTDYVPVGGGSGGGDPSVIVEIASDTPTTPDEVLGNAEGRLKAISMSGAAGSQYVTDPTSLTYPLSGVTYVEPSPGQTMEMTNISGTGILVVHNSAGDAFVKNTTADAAVVPCECFRGLLIADDIVHIHNRIIGAVVSLTPGPSSGNVIGNGSGEVLYSNEALANAMIAASQRYSIRSWREQ